MAILSKHNNSHRQITGIHHQPHEIYIDNLTGTLLAVSSSRRKLELGRAL
jgi:hypothetical protein